MLKKFTKMIFIGALALGVGVIAQPALTDAAGIYTATKTQSYHRVPYHWNGKSSNAYLWNYHLTKRQHRLAHYPVTTWYVSKSLKMTNGKKTGIFYQVTNSTNSVKGYVWRNYLSKGALSRGTYPAGLINSKLNQQLIQLFPRTIPNNRLQKAAEYYIHAVGAMEPADSFYDYLTATFNSDEQKQLFYLVNDPRKQKSYQQFKRGQISFLPYEKKWLNTALVDKRKSFTSFSGWQIGAYAFPRNSLYYGMIIIVLLPQQVN